MTLTSDDVTVTAAGDYAHAVGTWTMSGPAPDGSEWSDNGKFVAVWKNVDGDWKMAADIWNSDNPPMGMEHEGMASEGMAEETDRQLRGTGRDVGEQQPRLTERRLLATVPPRLGVPHTQDGDAVVAELADRACERHQPRIRRAPTARRVEPALRPAVQTHDDGLDGAPPPIHGVHGPLQRVVAQDPRHDSTTRLRG